MPGTVDTSHAHRVALNLPIEQALLGNEPATANKRTLYDALQLIAMLQTTLEVETLLRIFSREVNNSVNHSGLTYNLPEQDIALAIGRAARHRCHFELTAEKQSLGRLSFMRGNPFAPEDIARLEYLLSALMYQLRNALLYHNAMQATLTDPLTGAYNRNFIQRTLRREIGLARRYQQSFSLLVLDIDHFKQVNDRYGHDAGDQVICAVSNSIHATLRETDMLARFGGDEFVILLSNTNRHGATKLARKLQDTVAGNSYAIDGRVLRVGVSIGVASLLKTDTCQNLFCRADAALLEAKRAGRNGIAIAKADSICAADKSALTWRFR